MNRVRPHRPGLPRRLAIAGLLLAALLLAACGDSSSSTSPDATTPTPKPTPTPTCDAACQDTGTVQAVYSTVWFFWNSYIAGTPVGAKNVTQACPLGGTVSITGTSAYSSSTGISNVDVVYAMTNCRKSDASFDLSFTGAVSKVGTFKSATNFQAMTYSGSGVTIAGTVKSATLSVAQVPVNETCSVSFSMQRFDTGTGSISGTLCGRSVAYRW